MSKKVPKAIKVIALIMVSLSLISCGKPKQIVAKSNEEISQILGDNFYNSGGETFNSYISNDFLNSNESGVYPNLMIFEDGRNNSALLFQYAGEDWIFLKKIIVKTDEHEYKIDFDPTEVERNINDDPSLFVTERAYYSFKEKDYDMLTDMANSEETSVTFSGEKPAYFELTDRNKEILKLFLSCFEEK